ncbi:MAG: hypothetical protein ACRYFX_26325 [Janthinobacterium lividum]
MTQAYAGAGQPDSAYFILRRAEALADTLRGQAQQTALAEAKTRYRTSLQTLQIGQLTRTTQQQRSQSRLA